MGKHYSLKYFKVKPGSKVCFQETSHTEKKHHSFKYFEVKPKKNKVCFQETSHTGKETSDINIKDFEGTYPKLKEISKSCETKIVNKNRQRIEKPQKIKSFQDLKQGMQSQLIDLENFFKSFDKKE